jgi:hypothetical protein
MVSSSTHLRLDAPGDAASEPRGRTGEVLVNDDEASAYPDVFGATPSARLRPVPLWSQRPYEAHP